MTISESTYAEPRPITYWPAAPTPIAREPRWAIGQYGPRIIAQCSEADARIIVAAFQQMLDAGILPPMELNR